MNPRSRLMLASLGFAIAWTAFMWLWNAPLDTAGAVILVISGAIAGLLWYWGMNWWLKYSGRQPRDGQSP
jgi:hypothetical protein